MVSARIQSTEVTHLVMVMVNKGQIEAQGTFGAGGLGGDSSAPATTLIQGGVNLMAVAPELRLAILLQSTRENGRYCLT